MMKFETNDGVGRHFLRSPTAEPKDAGLPALEGLGLKAAMPKLPSFRVRRLLFTICAKFQKFCFSVKWRRDAQPNRDFHHLQMNLIVGKKWNREVRGFLFVFIFSRLCSLDWEVYYLRNG